MGPLTKNELELRMVCGCDDPACKSHQDHAPLDEIFLTPVCHNQGTVAVYHRGGVLSIHCVVCQRVVVHLAIA
jgi:Zn ribbon nucleic-acid-binding protein